MRSKATRARWPSARSSTAIAQPPYTPTVVWTSLDSLWTGLSQLDFGTYEWIASDPLYVNAYLSSLKIATIAVQTMELIRADLARLKIHHDVFFSERTLHGLQGDIETTESYDDLLERGDLDAVFVYADNRRSAELARLEEIRADSVDYLNTMFHFAVPEEVAHIVPQHHKDAAAVDRLHGLARHPVLEAALPGGLQPVGEPLRGRAEIGAGGGGSIIGRVRRDRRAAAVAGCR